MKLISLNTWGGRMFEPLVEFIRAEAETADIFCFQELYFNTVPHHSVFGIRPDLFLQIKNILPDFSVSERPASDGAYAKSTGPQDIRIGETIFVKKTAEIVDEDGWHTYVADYESALEGVEPSTGNFQYVRIKTKNDCYMIGNIHGLWVPGTKADTAKRIEQSRALEEFIEKQPGKNILCGDFNLQPDTKSIALLETNMRDLVKEYKVQRTRSRYYRDMEKYKDYIADYVFASPDIKIKTFQVLESEVSDHLPLMLEFS